MIITFPPPHTQPSHGLFPSPLLKHFAPVSEKMTLARRGGVEGARSKWKALAKRLALQVTWRHVSFLTELEERPPPPPPLSQGPS